MSNTTQKSTNLKTNSNKPYQTINNEPSLTQQQFAKQCDINYIMQGHPHVHRNYLDPKFNDLTKDLSWVENQNIVAKTKSDFEKFPLKVKEKFNNDVRNALNFMSDPLNLKESVKLGLIPSSVLPEEKEPEKVQKVTIVTEEKKGPADQAAV